MTSPAAAALRTELVAELAIIEPEIQGWQSLANDSNLSAEALAFIQGQISALSLRRDLDNAVLASLDNLEANGYPMLPDATVPVEIYDEINAHEEKIDAAVGTLKESTRAVAIVFGPPIARDKPTSTFR